METTEEFIEDMYQGYEVVWTTDLADSVPSLSDSVPTLCDRDSDFCIVSPASVTLS